MLDQRPMVLELLDHTLGPVIVLAPEHVERRTGREAGNGMLPIARHGHDGATLRLAPLPGTFVGTAGSCHKRSANLWWFSEEDKVEYRKHLVRFSAVALFVAALSACSLVSGRESGSQYVDDATITTKVKTQLASDVGLTPANQIHVETLRSVVQLSGFVDTAAHKAEAESVARNVEGVQGVENNITVQP